MSAECRGHLAANAPPRRGPHKCAPIPQVIPNLINIPAEASQWTSSSARLIHPLHFLLSYLFKIQFNIILPSVPGFGQAASYFQPEDKRDKGCDRDKARTEHGVLQCMLPHDPCVEAWPVCAELRHSEQEQGHDVNCNTDRGRERERERVVAVAAVWTTARGHADQGTHLQPADLQMLRAVTRQRQIAGPQPVAVLPCCIVHNRTSMQTCAGSTYRPRSCSTGTGIATRWPGRRRILSLTAGSPPSCPSSP
jgi:hypothetical protein